MRVDKGMAETTSKIYTFELTSSPINHCTHMYGLVLRHHEPVHLHADLSADLSPATWACLWMVGFSRLLRMTKSVITWISVLINQILTTLSIVSRRRPLRPMKAVWSCICAQRYNRSFYFFEVMTISLILKGKFVENK